jgi:hypothetical protein
LQRAHDATANLQRIVPRVTQIGSLFDELASVINAGRQQLGIESGGTFSRPTLVVPSTPAPELKSDDPWTSLAESFGTQGEETRGAGSSSLVCLRLEFESKPGPLDLRSVDDAVGEHPAVRDVALLDYDGRKATLKVWVEKDTYASDIQASLAEKATALFGPENEVSVTAHEEAA